MEWALFGMTFVISFLLIVILGEHLRQKRKLKLREIQQIERIAAMEKGISVLDMDEDILDSDNKVVTNPEQYKRKLHWFRTSLLAIGLFLVFGGLGMAVGFYLSDNLVFVEMGSLGAIPFMGGLGLLLFYYLTNKEAH